VTGITSAFASGPAPGTVDPFSTGLLAQNTGLAEMAMQNRYQQLGLGVPSGSPQQAAAGHTSLQNAGAGTAEQMDMGELPSLTGGIPGMAQATLGQMETQALNQPSGSGSSKGGSPLGGLGALGGLLGGGI
jgi:hypothetical protein